MIDAANMTDTEYMLCCQNSDRMREIISKMEFYAAEVERLREENQKWRLIASRLCHALEDLESVQNGPPLINYEPAWSKAMKATETALAAYDALTKETQ